jgi:hypothetical protein
VLLEALFGWLVMVTAAIFTLRAAYLALFDP